MSRASQVLGLHQITPRCFDLTRVRTGSVRDQLLRAALMCDALLSAGIVDVEVTDERARSLLVLGAGVAGVALALSAAERGAHVTVVERDTEPFGTLRDCYWRTVDPTEYDWPHDHWHLGKLPIPNPHSSRPSVSLPLAPSRLSGFELALVWLNANEDALYSAAIRAGRAVAYGKGRMRILYSHDADELTIDDASAARTSAKRSKGQPMSDLTKLDRSNLTRVSATSGSGWPSADWIDEEFAAVVSCVGLGTEVTSGNGTWTGYIGPTFWRGDDNMRPSNFLSSLHGSIPTNILISGSGDGAMQDFQRATTGYFGRDLYDKIESFLGTKQFQPKGFMQDAILAEDFARRSHAWRPDQDKAVGTLRYWHHSYERVVSELWIEWDPSTRLALARNILRPELIKFLTMGVGSTVRVLWVIREEVPTFSYALNRFLSLLTLKLMDYVTLGLKPPLRFGLLSQHKIAAIKPASPSSHSCGTPADCYCVSHVVTLAPNVKGSSLTDFDEEFDLILIRHGQEPTVLLGGGAVPEQQVPFDFPN
ncbi:NAD(P)-binding protein [Paraburkholderia polaris]|uniref:NAD(P)-binding protein n=1 Tax=Paraburkholderia polaris TaxID=2728848 RepID=UPI0038B31FDF